MKRETIVWIVGYGIAAIAVVILSYISVAWYFHAFPPLPFGLERMFQQVITFPPVPSPTPSTPFPTISRSRVMDPSNFIRRQEPGENPVYLIRGYTVGQLTKTGENSIRGSLYIVPDPNKTAIAFTLTGQNGLFVVGHHNEGFSEFPDSLTENPFEYLLRRIPPGTFVQIRVATATMPSKEKAILIKTLEDAVRGIWNLKNLTLHPFEIELIGQ